MLADDTQSQASSSTTITSTNDTLETVSSYSVESSSSEEMPSMFMLVVVFSTWAVVEWFKFVTGILAACFHPTVVEHIRGDPTLQRCRLAGIPYKPLTKKQLLAIEAQNKPKPQPTPAPITTPVRPTRLRRLSSACKRALTVVTSPPSSPKKPKAKRTVDSDGIDPDVPLISPISVPPSMQAELDAIDAALKAARRRPALTLRIASAVNLRTLASPKSPTLSSPKSLRSPGSPIRLALRSPLKVFHPSLKRSITFGGTTHLTIEEDREDLTDDELPTPAVDKGKGKCVEIVEMVEVVDEIEMNDMLEVVEAVPLQKPAAVVVEQKAAVVPFKAPATKVKIPLLKKKKIAWRKVFKPALFVRALA